MSARLLLEPATEIAIEIEHPAYDCLYVALAVMRDCWFVTADHHFLRKLGAAHTVPFGGRATSLMDVSRLPGPT